MRKRSAPGDTPQYRWLIPVCRQTRIQHEFVVQLIDFSGFSPAFFIIAAIRPRHFKAWMPLPSGLRTKLSTKDVGFSTAQIGLATVTKTPRCSVIIRARSPGKLRSHKTCGGPPLFSIIQAAGWPIWPLLACSVLGLALIIERSLSLRPAKVAPPQLLQEVLSATKEGVPTAEVIDQLERNSILGEVLANGLRALQAKPAIAAEELQATLESAGRVAAHKLARYLTALATIASVAPLLGLLGTVVGMIEIFGSQSPSGSNPAQLAHGISIALYNTAFGLIIAIPSLIFWRYFRARVDEYLLTLELAAERLLQHLLSLRAAP